jgi:hypothetical protein
MATDIERLRYYEHQYLGAVDFQDEQDYQRDMRRRHSVGLHAWGIVVGLELEERDPVSGASGPIEMYIRPGMAIDGFGRELVLLEPFQIPPDPRLFQGLFGAGYVPVWITYAQNSVRRPVPGWEQCLSDDQFGRVQENFRVLVGLQISPHTPIVVAGQTVTTSSTTSGSSLTGITIPPDEAVPYQDLPSDDADPVPRWLIRLGSVNWDATRRAFLQGDPATLAEERRYVSLIGERALVPRRQLLIRNRFDEDGVTRAIVENTNTGPSSGAEAVARESDTAGIRVGWFGSGRAAVSDLQPGTAMVSALPDAEQLAFNHEGNGGQLTFHTKNWHERMRISEDGLVGIGTKTPAAGLDVRRDWDGEQGDVQLLGDKPSVRLTGSESWLLQLGANDPGTLEFLHRSGAAQWDTVLDLQADGRVDVPGAFGLRQADLYLSGRNNWSSVTYNARHGAVGTPWIFPDPARNAVTVEMDDYPGFGRFEVWGTTNANKQAWTRRLAINTDSGDVFMADFGGKVGIGTSTPDQKLEVVGNVHVTGDLDVGGNILKGGNGALKVLAQPYAVRNGERVGAPPLDGRDRPGEWMYDHTGLITERIGAFVVLNGFTIFGQFEGSTDWENKGHPHNVNATAIPQLVYARRTDDDSDPNRVSGIAYTSESFVSDEGDNATLFTVVVIGRK